MSYQNRLLSLVNVPSPKVGDQLSPFAGFRGSWDAGPSGLNQDSPKKAGLVGAIIPVSLWCLVDPSVCPYGPVMTGLMSLRTGQRAEALQSLLDPKNIARARARTHTHTHTHNDSDY